MQYQWHINTSNQAKFLSMVYYDGHLFWTATVLYPFYWNIDLYGIWRKKIYTQLMNRVAPQNTQDLTTFTASVL